jgi:hypothetical protein
MDPDAPRAKLALCISMDQSVLLELPFLKKTTWFCGASSIPELGLYGMHNHGKAHDKATEIFLGRNLGRIMAAICGVPAGSEKSKRRVCRCPGRKLCLGSHDSQRGLNHWWRGLRSKACSTLYNLSFFCVGYFNQAQMVVSHVSETNDLKLWMSH